MLTRHEARTRRSGLLWKESRSLLGPSWKQYLFVAEESRLYYFDAADTNLFGEYDLSLLLDRHGLEPLGSMQLELTIVSNTKSARGDRWAMRLSSEGRKWIIAGDDAEQSRQWAETLEQFGARNTYDPSRRYGGPDESGRSESSLRNPSDRERSGRLDSQRGNAGRRESSEKLPESPSLTSLRAFLTGKPVPSEAPPMPDPPPTPEPTSPARRDGPAEMSLTSMLRHEQFGKTGMLGRFEERKSELNRYLCSIVSPSSSRATSRANSRATTPATSREPSERLEASGRSERRGSRPSLRISSRRGSADASRSSRRGSQEVTLTGLERVGESVETRVSEGAESRTSEAQ